MILHGHVAEGLSGEVECVPLRGLTVGLRAAPAARPRNSMKSESRELVTCTFAQGARNESLGSSTCFKLRVRWRETALVTLKPGARFDADRFRAAVTDAGQDTRHVEVRLRGAVRLQDVAYSVEARPGLLLAFSSSSASRLQQYSGKTIRARARVSSPVRSPLELDLIAIE